MWVPPKNRYLYTIGVVAGGGSAFVFLLGARSTYLAVSHSDSTPALLR